MEWNKCFLRQEVCTHMKFILDDEWRGYILAGVFTLSSNLTWFPSRICDKNLQNRKYMYIRKQNACLIITTKYV